MSRVAIQAADLNEPVFKAVAKAAGKAGRGDAKLSGYDPASGMFEYDVDRRDGTSHVVCVHLVMETFVGRAVAMG